MDSVTKSFYDDNSELLVERYNNSSPEYTELFINYFEAGSTVLDIGSGSGRDLAILLQLGFKAYGIEPSKSMIESSYIYHKTIKDKVYLGCLPDEIPTNLPFNIWDNIVVAAMLQHIPESKLSDTLLSIYKLLEDNGKLLLSIPTKYPNIVNNRDKYDRLFYLRSKYIYLRLLQRIGFSFIHETVSLDSLGRDDTEWTTLILKK